MELLTTEFSQPANLTTYTILSLFSLQVELAPHLLSPYLDHLYLHHYKPPTAVLDMCWSAPFFIPSTSFCSLSSWFTTSSTCHLITVTIFALTIYHSLDPSLQTYRTQYSQAYATVLCPSPSVVYIECILAKQCVLEQKLLLTAYRKSYIRNRLVPK